MSALKYLKEVANLQRHFSNGMIMMEIRDDGIKMTGFRDYQMPEVTFSEKTITWLQLETRRINPLRTCYDGLVISLGLEAEDAGG